MAFFWGIFTRLNHFASAAHAPATPKFFLPVLLLFSAIQPVNGGLNLCKRKDSIPLSPSKNCRDGFGVTEGCCYKCKTCPPGWELRHYQEDACPRQEPDCDPCKDGYYSNNAVKTLKCRPDRNCADTYQVTIPGTYSKVKASECGHCLDSRYVPYMNDIRFGCVEKAVETVTLSTMSNGVGKNTVLDIDADMSDSAVFNRDHKPRTQQILKEDTPSHKINVIYILLLVLVCVVLLVIIFVVVPKVMKWWKGQSVVLPSTDHDQADSNQQSQSLLSNGRSGPEDFTISVDGGQSVEIPNEAIPYGYPRANNNMQCEPATEVNCVRSLVQPGHSGNFVSAEVSQSEDGSVNQTLDLPDGGLSNVGSIEGILSQRSNHSCVPDRSNNRNVVSCSESDSSLPPNTEGEMCHNSEKGQYSENATYQPMKTEKNEEVRVASSDVDSIVSHSTHGSLVVTIDDETKPSYRGSTSSIQSVMTNAATRNSNADEDLDLDSCRESTPLHPSEEEDYMSDDTDDDGSVDKESSEGQGKCSHCGKVIGKVTARFHLCQHCQREQAKKGRIDRQHSFTAQVEDERNPGRKYSTNDQEPEENENIRLFSTVQLYGKLYLNKLQPRTYTRLLYHLDNTDANASRNLRERFAIEMGMGPARSGTYSASVKLWQDLCQGDKTVKEVIDVLNNMQMKWALREFCEDLRSHVSNA